MDPLFVYLCVLFSWDVLSHLDERFPPWDDPELLIENNGFFFLIPMNYNFSSVH